VTGPRVGRPGRGPSDPPSRPTGWVALTGTPGTGKSSVARQLPAAGPVIEVRSLALELGTGRRLGRGVAEVDMTRLRRTFRSYMRLHPSGVVVGHLAHFLPVDRVVVLRCHPTELARRLRRSGRPLREREANVLSEVLDLILVEALGERRPVHEIDTTGRSVAAVARSVGAVVRRPGPARYGRLHWLADPRVTAQLLRRAR
jgi:adenylate kinase